MNANETLNPGTSYLVSVLGTSQDLRVIVHEAYLVRNCNDPNDAEAVATDMFLKTTNRDIAVRHVAVTCLLDNATVVQFLSGGDASN
mgnify:CR=1 FL=1